MPAYPSPSQHEQIMDASQMIPSTVPLLPTAQAGDGAHRHRKELTITAARHRTTAVGITLDDCSISGVAAGLCRQQVKYPAEN